MQVEISIEMVVEALGDEEQRGPILVLGQDCLTMVWLQYIWNFL